MDFELAGRWDVGGNTQVSFNYSTNDYYSGWGFGGGCTTASVDGTLAGTCQTVVPEPITIVLLGTGLAGLGAIRARRRKKDDFA
jgi:hypothetical protein